MPPRSQVPALVAAMDVDGLAVRRRDIIARFGRSAFDQVRAQGRIVAVLPAIYAHAAHAERPLTRAVAASRWLVPHGTVGGSAACLVHGLAPRNPQPVCVLVPDPVHVNAPEWMRVRRSTHPPVAQVVRGVNVVPLPDALILAWRDEGPDQARGLILDALREGRATMAELGEALPRHPRLSRRRELRGFLAGLRDGVHSYLEHLADNSVLNAPGLRGFERQVVLRVAGRGYRVDAFDVESRTAIEFDGAKYHSDDRARRRDLERDVDLASIGVQTLRFTFEDVADRPSWCRDQILRTIATRRRH